MMNITKSKLRFKVLFTMVGLPVFIIIAILINQVIVVHNQDLLRKRLISYLSHQQRFEQAWMGYASVAVEKRIVSLGRRTIPALVDILKDESLDVEIREIAARYLGKIMKAKEATMELLEIVKSSDNIGRFAASWALDEILKGGTDDPIVIESLVEIVKEDIEKDLFYAEWAAWRLVSSIPLTAELRNELKRDKDFIDKLFKLWNGKYSSRRTPAIRLLTYLLEDKAKDILLEALKDPDEYIRIFAAKSLGKTEPDRAISVLIPLLESKNSRIRQQAAQTIKQITGKEYDYKK